MASPRWLWVLVMIVTSFGVHLGCFPTKLCVCGGEGVWWWWEPKRVLSFSFSLDKSEKWRKLKSYRKELKTYHCSPAYLGLNMCEMPIAVGLFGARARLLNSCALLMINLQFAEIIFAPRWMNRAADELLVGTEDLGATRRLNFFKKSRHLRKFG